MNANVLSNIRGFDTAYNRISDLSHYIKHIAVDIVGVGTPDGYLELAQRLGSSAAHGENGTFVKTRGNGDLVAYVDNSISRPHSLKEGIILVVRSRGSYGLVATMFAPDEGKRYFDEKIDLMLM